MIAKGKLKERVFMIVADRPATAALKQPQFDNHRSLDCGTGFV
jgi:hypothetical protein